MDVLVGGLARLEYRGYDSAGLAVRSDDGVTVVRQVGRIADLEQILGGIDNLSGDVGIGHTRWATHGAPTTMNAHPHQDCTGEVIVAHNGIIENWLELKAELQERGHAFTSETDTEVVAHLLEEMADLSLAAAVREVMRRAQGALALVVMRRSDPGVLVGSRRGSPLVVGVGEGEAFLASDIPAFLEYTRRMQVVDDDRVVEVRADRIEMTDLDGNAVTSPERLIEWDLEAAEKGGYPSFMLKEIHEQGQAIANTLRGRLSPDGRVHLDEMAGLSAVFPAVDKVFVIACGTSYHAAMMAKYAIERWTRLPVEIDIASEFRYRDPVLDDRSLVIAISQSGETIDTLAAFRYARHQGSPLIGVTNVVDSALARESDAVLYTRAGPEIGVAATKTFTTQLVAMQMLGLHVAQERNTLEPDEIAGLVDALRRLPEQVEKTVVAGAELEQLSSAWSSTRDFFFLGRSGDFPVAMEGALKLKEIAYVRAEGYAAGEMKHGPIALVEPGVVVAGVATDAHVRSKTLSNMQEMKARGATILLVVEEGNEAEAAAVADHLVVVPAAPDLVCTVNAVIPLQLLAYYLAAAKGLDVDKPRNLAKTVTVE
jgi:glucosamine--fructose-6-phosphate aminotransferase (isomerizing)